MRLDSVHDWWLKVLQAPVADPGDWDRQPERAALYGDYVAFCKRARTKPIGVDAFIRCLRAIMPERGFAARLRTAPDSGDSGGYRRRDVPVRFEHLCIPALGECRRAFEATMGTGPLEWPECRGDANGPERDVSAVEDWWRWKLDSGVTVPDEADPYGQDDVYWNRTAAADLLFASYRGFCEDEGREPVRPGFFVELFDALLPRDVRSDRRILFRGCDGNAEGRVDVGRLERVLCYRLPLLADCRDAFVANTGRIETWPAAADEPARNTPVTRAPDRDAVQLWWRWKLALGCIIPDERIGPQLPNDGPTYEWESSAYALALHADCAEFCRRHGRRPVEFGAFMSEFAALAPAGMPENPDHDEIDIPPLEECRAWFADRIAGEPIAWPTRADSGD